jgi:DNA-binding CsgD family transcriptional regulator/PAS domain-containing protein
MASGDDLVATIEAVHAAGLDTQLWPHALAAVTALIGGIGATLEVIAKPTLCHREFRFAGLPPAEQLEYLDHYAALNPRLQLVLPRKSGEVTWDYQGFDENAMDSSPFYADFLTRMDLRYFVTATIEQSQQEFTVVTVQRSPAQGHVDRGEIALVRRLLPHLQQAFDVGRRLKTAGDSRLSFESALNWLADGVAVLAINGAVLHVNEAFRAIARRNDGISTRRGMIEFAAVEPRARLEAAIGAARQLRGGGIDAPRAADFPIHRPSGAPSYFVSVRPLLDKQSERTRDTEAVAILFIRDPTGRNAAAACMLREVFGLTESEANLAQALQSGIALGDYAQSHAVSLNTVYTHLRRVKEKTGCKRLSELIHKLNDLQVPLRVD